MIMIVTPICGFRWRQFRHEVQWLFRQISNTAFFGVCKNRKQHWESERRQHLKISTCKHISSLSYAPSISSLEGWWFSWILKLIVAYFSTINGDFLLKNMDGYVWKTTCEWKSESVERGASSVGTKEIESHVRSTDRSHDRLFWGAVYWFPQT